MSEANARHVVADMLAFTSEASAKPFLLPEQIILTMRMPCKKLLAARSTKSAEQCDDAPSKPAHVFAILT